MDKIDFFKLWVKKLRSGEYKQQHEGYLKIDIHSDGPSFCCLGVACDLYDKHVDKLLVRECDNLSDIEGKYYTYDGCSSHLPESVQKYLGITMYGNLELSEIIYDLAQLNDYTGLSFKELADIIEKEWIKKVS